ncbi:coiled-coil domain-containing protein 96-like [Episyrphus balteatus]|uniref:coiled-coil domain-containing protein 96-like n=1 Tax=Episyrphus balteatus TaxID=286459 RepID=UPI0024858D8F|nr:coiled-coil domain-containing protein 96-like [Episyrphus balteatus]
MDEESECDWTPPLEIDIVESELFEIPSGLPSLEDFINSELEKEEVTKAEVDETDETLLETHKEYELTTEGGGFETGSIAVDHDEEDEEAQTAAADNIQSEDDYELPQVEVKKPKVKTKKHTVDTFGMDSVKLDFDNIKTKAKKEADANLRLHLIDSTNNLIDNLIGEVVEICEYEDPDDILRARLDKNKVCDELDDKMYELDIEQKMRFFLNRKAVEYFRRKKATRPLIDDSPESKMSLIRKYHESLMMVNKYKGLEDSTKGLLETKIAELKEELKELEINSKGKSREFVDIVKNTLGASNSEKMETLIDSFTKRIKNMQEEISKVRFVLIQRQHSMAVLQERARKLDDLGNGLHMVDFEHLQTETQALGKKIEERNNELNRLHTRCNADIHTLAHIREKQQMMRNTISAQQEAFEELIEEKQSCREYLNDLKIERGAIRRELKKISFQNGLLDKPELLLDYDVTEEKVNDLKERIALIKAEQLNVDEKLKQITKILRR